MPVFGTNSDIHPIIRRNQVHSLLLGDAGFGDDPWSLTTFRIPDYLVQQALNNICLPEGSLSRSVLDNKNRSTIFYNTKLDLRLKKVHQIIAWYFILHNIAKYLKDNDKEDKFEKVHIGDENISSRKRKYKNNLYC